MRKTNCWMKMTIGMMLKETHSMRKDKVEFHGTDKHLPLQKQRLTEINNGLNMRGDYVRSMSIVNM